MSRVIPTELKSKLASNREALKVFMRVSARVKENFVDYVISGNTTKSRKCRANKAIQALTGTPYASLTPC